MKFTYIPVQDADGKWQMVAKLDESQRRAADKARRRILNIKDDNPWWMVDRKYFEMPPITFAVPREWPWSVKPFNGGDSMRIPFQYSHQLAVDNPRTSFILHGFNGI